MPFSDWREEGDRPPQAPTHMECPVRPPRLTLFPLHRRSTSPMCGCGARGPLRSRWFLTVMAEMKRASVAALRGASDNSRVHKRQAAQRAGGRERKGPLIKGGIWREKRTTEKRDDGVDLYLYWCRQSTGRPLHGIQRPKVQGFRKGPSSQHPCGFHSLAPCLRALLHSQQQGVFGRAWMKLNGVRGFGSYAEHVRSPCKPGPIWYLN
mmetsp:Transcript_3428/g.7096  ORF Transcript_3428/g.7096 Transcript_3428/m.7096 type:complete len:208 (+) Transcript_3428:1106-1729(+)